MVSVKAYFSKAVLMLGMSLPLSVYGQEVQSGKDAQSGTHTFIQVTDTEIWNVEGSLEWADEIRRYAANSGASFIVHTGDLCYESGLRAHIQLMNTGNMGIPVYYGIGNHDLVKGETAEGLFESIYGPVWYSFDVEGVHYVMLPMLRGDHKPSYTIEDAAAWLEKDLAGIKPGTPVVVFSHNLLTGGNDFIYGGTDLNKYNLKAWIYGHLHTNYKRMQGDVMTVCTSSSDKGGIDHSAAGFRVFTVDNRTGEISTELRYPYIDRKVSVSSPCGISGTSTLTVNTYSTTAPAASVSYQCFCDGKPVGKKGESVQRTGWTWTADMNIGRKYYGKEMTVEVSIQFSDGSTASASSGFTFSPGCNDVSLTDDWTNLLGNASHTGVGKDIGTDLSLAWVTNVGGEIFMTSPVVYNGNIYTATTDEDMHGNAYICALDGRTGDILWKYPVRGSVKNSIAADSGLVFAQDIYGNLYAVNATDGKLVWEKKLEVNNGTPSLNSGLAAEAGTVYAGNGLGFAAFEALTGKMLWKNNDWKQREGTTTTTAVGDGVTIDGVQWMALYGNDALTGKMLWSHSGDGLRERGASAAIHGHLAYIISGKSLFIIEARTGKIMVRKELPYDLKCSSTPLLTENRIIFGTAKEGVVALGRETLEEKWHYRTGDALIFTVPYSKPGSCTVEGSPVLAGKTVYIGASDGKIYGLDAETGKEVWKYGTGAAVLGSVAVSGNSLIATDFGGNVYAFSRLPGRTCHSAVKKEKTLHSTYLVASRLKSEDDIVKKELRNYDFIYLVAAPAWKAEDFDLGQEEIDRKYVREFSYKNEKLVSKFIRTVHGTGGKILCSFSGDAFADIASSPERSRKFAAMMAAFVHKYGYDGIELDWEHTVRADSHIGFMKEIRSALDSLGGGHRRYWLTTALHAYMPGGPYTKVQSEELCSSVDWINIMYYDLGGGLWEKSARHNAPLDMIQRNFENCWKFFPPEKVHIGLASYGFYYKGIKPEEKVPEGKRLRDYGRFCNYTELPPLLEKGWTEVWDDKARCPYYISPDGNEFMTLESPRSLDAKFEWIFEKGFGGVFWWEYTCDWIRPSGKIRGVHLITDYVTGKITGYL